MALKSANSRRLEVGRLDEYFQTVKAESGLSGQAPPRGWIRAMRDALGMSAAAAKSVTATTNRAFIPILPLTPVTTGL